MQINKLKDIKNCKVLIYGDFMIDKYIIGNVSRISPEAPVPIIEVKKKESKLGGAGNVVNNIVGLGASAKVLGCIGDDFESSFIIDQLKNMDVDTTYLYQSDEMSTIVKTRISSRNQQYLRCDEEQIKDMPTSYIDKILDNMDEVFADVSVVIISDYAKGAVVKKLSTSLIEAANKKNIPIIVDPKGTDYSKYQGATMCTPNMKELRDVSGLSLMDEAEVILAGNQLRKEINLEYLMLTRSEKGISIFENNHKKTDYPAIEKDVVDVTGAGDTVVSVVALCLGVGYTVGEASSLSNYAASIVCSKFGAATVSMNELLENVMFSGDYKVIDANVAKIISQSLKEKGKKLVFTNGCFDLIHAGHISSFVQARNFGDELIVAVNSDESVRRLKGPKRPIASQENRMAMLCALECIDYVILMEDDNPINLITTIKPDVAVKGKDWENKEVPEKKVIESYGGEMEFIDLEQGLSTTNIIRKIVEINEK